MKPIREAGRGLGSCGECGRRFLLRTSRGAILTTSGARWVCPRCSDAFDDQARALAAKVTLEVRS